MKRSLSLAEIPTDAGVRGDPSPRSGALAPPGPVDWPVVRDLAGRPLERPPSIPFAEIFEARRSRRVLQPPSLREVAQALFFALQARYTRAEDPFERRFTPVPSGGALHPVHTLLTDPRGAPRAFLVDADGERLRQLAVCQPSSLLEFHQQRNLIAPEARGVVLMFAAEASRTRACYENGDSLVWRDAGALLQSVFLSAEAFGLGFLPLGVLGAPLLQSVGLAERLVPCGAAVMGRR